MALLINGIPSTLFLRQRLTEYAPHTKKSNLWLSSTTNFHLNLYNFHQKPRYVRYSPLRAETSLNGVALSNFDLKEDVSSNSSISFIDRLRILIHFIRSILPGGDWWNLTWDKNLKKEEKYANHVTVIYALRRMWDLVSADRGVIIIGFISLLLAAVSEISIPHFLAASIFSAQIGQTEVFHRNVKLMILLCFTSGIGSGLRGCCFGIANMNLVKRMRESLYSTLLFQDIPFFDNETVGDLISRLGSDCQQVSRVIGHDLNLISRNILQGAGALIYLLILSWPIALCTMGICATLALIMSCYGQYQKKLARLTQEYTACANEVSQETLSLIRAVRVYGTEQQEFQRYSKWLEKLADISLRQSFAFGLWSFSFNQLYHSAQVVAVLLGGISIMAGHINAEQLTKFILYSEWLILSTWWVGDNWSSLMQSIGASEKVFQLMNLSPSKQFLSQGSQLQNFTGDIKFVNVSFQYPSREMVAVLQGINISIRPNELLALVGLSGSGKSTIVNLLLRLYEPTSGQILIDGVPIEELDIKWIRERIGYVGQEPRLFRMDIGSNIRYGCTRKITQDDIERAARQAFAHDFIMSFPNGYETIVDNALLSGGQKQRIAIARAILRDPDILILDEATSALDAESEHYVKEVLHAMRPGTGLKRTVIVIAHRLSTIRAADRIVVMNSGNIVEVGKHADLLHRNGLYAQLIKRQEDALA